MATMRVLAAVWALSTIAPAATVPERIGKLETKVRSVEAIRAVKRLQNAYGHYAELGLWNDFADLFADNAIGYYPAGKLIGKEAIRKLFLQDVGKGRIGLDDGRLYPHIMLQPVITIEPGGKTAKGRWRVLAMLGSYGGNASWAGGVYENQYVLENGVWKIGELHYYGRFSGAYGTASWKETKEAIPFHYDAGQAGSPIPDATGQPAPNARLAGLAQRVERLKDESEVTSLQHLYGYYVDRRQWDQVADLFSADGTMELGQRGVYAGRSSIRHALDQFGPAGDINDHLQLQTLVSIAPDGRTAKARGVQLAVSGAQLEEGIFENQYVKQGGTWKIRSLHYYPRVIADYERGWAKDAKPAPGASKDSPPDHPPTEVYETFPKFYMIPPHFSHPVTGPPVRATGGLKATLAEVERGIELAKAYDAAENLASAYGYHLDESMQTSAVAAYQIMQPVIQVAPDGKSLKMRARSLQFGGVPGGKGSWMPGIYESQAVSEGGVWKLKSMELQQTP